jgi:heat shock protein HtpX
MNAAQLRAHRRDNHLQSIILILGIALIMGVVGYVLGGRLGVWMALVFSAVSALVSPVISPRMILRMYQARPLEPRHAPELYALVDELVKRAELAHPPALYYVPTRMLNAFAVGGDRNAAIALTDGLLRTMSPRELSGILAHELSHVRYRDTRLMALGDAFSRLTALMSQIGQLLLLLALPAALMGAPFISLWGLLVLIFAPAASTMLQLALSRSREFHADMGAIELTHDPVGLASALKKLERAQTDSFWRRIFVPYRVLEPTVLRTHPATEERIERLMSLVSEASATFPALRPDEPPLGRRVPPEPDDFPRIRDGPQWHVSGLRY